MGKGILHKTSQQGHLSAKREGKKVKRSKTKPGFSHGTLASNSLSLLSLSRHTVTHSLASKVGFCY